MRLHLLTIALILTGTSGCDNVKFGGMDMELRPPPSVETTDPSEPDTVQEAGPSNPAGPILLAGLRDGPRANLVVVGEVHDDALHVFPDPGFPEDQDRLAELVAPGAEWIVFSEGVRVGRMFVDSSDEVAGFCGPRVGVGGVVELVPSAAVAERLLALPAGFAADRPYGDYRTVAHDYDQRVATLTIAGAAMTRLGATRPPLGLLDARRHIQAFRPTGAQGASIAATFVVQDRLEIAAPGQGAYALFVMGEDGGSGYEESYVWHRDVAADGKGAPRYFDHLDLNQDGSDEIVMDVFGSERRWFATLGRRDGAWVRTFQDSCGSGASAED
jgi:hypothetical protein